MVLVVITKVVITQVPTDANPNRNKVYTFPYVTEFKSESSWANLTGKGSIKFPKNIWVTDENGNKINLGGGVGGSNNNLPVNATYGTQPPLFLRGDKINIYAGYGYFDSTGKPKIVTNQIPANYITKVTPKLPIELELEDNMYLCKQVQCPNKNWGKLSMEQIVSELIDLANQQFPTANLVFKNSLGVFTNVGDFRTQNETIAQVLNRLQKDYKIESFFRGNELFCGLITYYPNTGTEHNFVFQKNIISDQLQYTRKDDIKIGLKAYSINKTELQTTTKSGKKRTSKKRLEVFVGTPQANDGQIRTMYFWDVQTAYELKKMATQALGKLNYEGFRGKFTTLGLPLVLQGDRVNLTDNILPERSGKYFVKSVDYSGGFSIGLRQEIEVELRIDNAIINNDGSKSPSIESEINNGSFAGL